MQSKINKKACLIVNCYNSEDYLEATLNSLVSQTHSNLVILCVDNCSTDKTKEIIFNMMRSDKRLLYHKVKKHLNLVDARIFAIELIKTMGGIDYFGFCDSDDLWSPHWVSSLLRVSEGYDILFSNGYELYEERHYKRKVEKSFSNHNKDAFSSPIYLQSALLSSKLLNDKLSFDRQLQNIYDLDFFIQLWKKDTKYIHISDFLFTYRVHSNSLSKNKKLQIFVERWKVTKKHNLSRLRFVIKYFFIIFGFYRVKNMLKLNKNLNKN